MKAEREISFRVSKRVKERSGSLVELGERVKSPVPSLVSHHSRHL